MKTIRLMTFLLAAMGMATCSNDDNDIIDNAQEQPLPLTITVTENPLQNPDAPAQATDTRAAVTTTSTLSKFTLDYQYSLANDLVHDYMTVSKDGDGKWTASATWPSPTSEVSWYAHTDGVFYSQSAPYLSFSVEEQANSQKDLLVAKASGTQSGTGGNLHFTFDHACTALKFYVKKSTNLDGYTLKVTSIKLCNIVKQGKCYFPASWEPGTTRTSYTLYSGSGKTLDSDSETGWTLLNTNENDYLFLIPQTLTAWDTSTDIASATTQTYFQLECTITKNSDNSIVFTDKKAYIPFGATLSAGYQHDVKINIGKNSLYKSPNTLIINN